MFGVSRWLRERDREEARGAQGEEKRISFATEYIPGKKTRERERESRREKEETKQTREKKNIVICIVRGLDAREKRM